MRELRRGPVKLVGGTRLLRGQSLLELSRLAIESLQPAHEDLLITGADNRGLWRHDRRCTKGLTEPWLSVLGEARVQEGSDRLLGHRGQLLNGGRTLVRRLLINHLGRLRRLLQLQS